MSARRLFPGMALGLLVAACHVGPQIDQSGLGRQPQGAKVDVELTTKTKSKRVERRGELLEVRDDGLVILGRQDADNGPRVVLIPWQMIYRASASDLPGIAVRASQGDSQRQASTEELRNVSRFPQGLSAELMSQLLGRYGQSTLEAIQ